MCEMTSMNPARIPCTIKQLYSSSVTSTFPMIIIYQIFLNKALWKVGTNTSTSTHWLGVNVCKFLFHIRLWHSWDKPWIWIIAKWVLNNVDCRNSVMLCRKGRFSFPLFLRDEIERINKSFITACRYKTHDIRRAADSNNLRC